MKKVHFSQTAQEAIYNYYENYQIFSTSTDLAQRAFHISQIRSCLTFIDAYWENTYVKNGKNYLSIYKIAEVEYIESITSILVTNIYFRN